MFAVMGMYPVGYDDLSLAGSPMHATAFRPNTQEALARNLFRVFTTVLHMDLLTEKTRNLAQRALEQRDIFTPRLLELLDHAKTKGGMTRILEFWCESLCRFVRPLTTNLVSHRATTFATMFALCRQFHRFNRGYVFHIPSCPRSRSSKTSVMQSGFVKAVWKLKSCGQLNESSNIPGSKGNNSGGVV